MQVTTPLGNYITLGRISDITYRAGPDRFALKIALGRLCQFWHKMSVFAEVNRSMKSQRYLKSKIDSGELVVPAGVRYIFSGSL